ncbi:Protein CBG25800 [Caenorhabditis briggsae]|uniref:Protein CBG25800 n=1 Tax=Caenorhabditis briggsae TaxID=6238 RepID=B6IGM3_CAEBR|nr:Protein CBG25800 [Caenorhabditis briggsae]CAR99053.1 Protein CBG25800 [Caenorhabditis briggsae]
MKINFFCMS